MTNWKTEIIEISNNVYKLVMVHELGSIIEKTGIDVENLKTEALEDALEVERQIQEKLKN